MFKPNVWSALIILLSSFQTVRAHEPHTLPIEEATIDGIKKFVEDEGIITVTELVYRLPDILRSNYVLIEKSRSRQPSNSPEFPRMILYLPTGDLFIGISTDPRMPNSDDVEMLQYENQQWRLEALTLGGDRNARSFSALGHQGSPSTGGRCTACHGDPSRPIWGSYPVWPGAIHERLTQSQAEALTKVWSDKNHPNQRLRALYRTKNTWAAGEVVTLPNQKRGNLNESLNQVIANRHTYHLSNKIQAHPKADLLRMASLASKDDVSVALDPDVVADLRRYIGTEWNRSPVRLEYPRAIERDFPLLLAGLDPKCDLLVDRTLPECNAPDAPEYDFTYWNSATVYLGDSLRVLTIHNLRSLPLPNLNQVLDATVYEPEFGDRTTAGNFLTSWKSSIEERDAQIMTDLLKNNYYPMLNLRSQKIFSPSVVGGTAGSLNDYARQLLLDETNNRVNRTRIEYKPAR